MCCSMNFVYADACFLQPLAPSSKQLVYVKAIGLVTAL